MTDIKTIRIKAARKNLENAVSLVVQAFKKRDSREPMRLKKQATEEKIQRIVRRALRKQSENIRSQLEMTYPNRKTNLIPPVDVTDWEEGDMGDLIDELIQATLNGISLFGAGYALIDYTLTNVEAAKKARDYAYDLVKGINETTRKALQDAVSMFVETPGMTIGDLMALLPFDEARAMQIAITETTRAYAEGQQMAGEALAEEFPDVRVTKTWFTNNDDRVCEICGPLEGVEVEIGEDFGDGISNPPAHVNCRCWTDSGTRI
jgi:hypothetical protein